MVDSIYIRKTGDEKAFNLNNIGISTIWRKNGSQFVKEIGTLAMQQMPGIRQ